MYVSAKSLEQAHVRAFVEYFLTEGTALVSEVGYVQLSDGLYRTLGLRQVSAAQIA